MRDTELGSLARTYANMIQRCTNPANSAYGNYGGRGITVCDRWTANKNPRGEAFRNFCADLGPRPFKMTLERIDTNGPYCPENCKWATKQEQARNTRKKRLISIDGRQIHVAELADETGIDMKTLYWRIQQGWAFEKVISKEPQWNNSDSVKKAVAAATLKKSLMTHCKRGHEFSEENTHRHNGRRTCKTCRRAHDRNAYRRQKV